MDEKKKRERKKRPQGKEKEAWRRLGEKTFLLFLEETAHLGV